MDVLETVLVDVPKYVLEQIMALQTTGMSSLELVVLAEVRVIVLVFLAVQEPAEVLVE